jgi:hypothetical protein
MNHQHSYEAFIEENGRFFRVCACGEKVEIIVMGFAESSHGKIPVYEVKL